MAKEFESDQKVPEVEKVDYESSSCVSEALADTIMTEVKTKIGIKQSTTVEPKQDIDFYNARVPLEKTEPMVHT